MEHCQTCVRCVHRAMKLVLCHYKQTSRHHDEDIHDLHLARRRTTHHVLWKYRVVSSMPGCVWSTPLARASSMQAKGTAGARSPCLTVHRGLAGSDIGHKALCPIPYALYHATKSGHTTTNAHAADVPPSAGVSPPPVLPPVRGTRRGRGSARRRLGGTQFPNANPATFVECKSIDT